MGERLGSKDDYEKAQSAYDERYDQVEHNAPSPDEARKWLNAAGIYPPDPKQYDIFAMPADVRRQHDKSKLDILMQQGHSGTEARAILRAREENKR